MELDSINDFEVLNENGKRIIITNSPEETELVMSLLSETPATRATGYSTVYEKVGPLQSRYTVVYQPTNKATSNSAINITINTAGGSGTHTVSLQYKDFKVSYSYATSGSGDSIRCTPSTVSGKNYCGIRTTIETVFQQFKEYQIPHNAPGKKYYVGITTTVAKVGKMYDLYHVSLSDKRRVEELGKIKPSWYK